VTRATADRAPLWLQEGVAKREEVRWREPGPFDDRPSPDALVLRGFELKLGVPLDKLGPSVAMLPSADAAMVAFAEVTSFVRYLATSGGPDTLPKLLLAIRAASDPDAALRDSTGADLHAWDDRWRAYLAGKPHEALPTIYGLGAPPSDTHELQRRMRLAQLLYGRRHPGPALHELDLVATSSGSHDPSVRSLRASVLGALGRKAEGEQEVHDPADVTSSYAPWWAIRGRWERQDGDDPAADASFVEAVSADPFDVQAACQIDDSDEERAGDFASGTAAGALCDAAKARHEPPVGRE
jgi:hypothetical protein